MPKLLIIDGSSMLSTSYYGNLPKSILFAKTEEEKERHYPEILHTSDGKYTNAMFTMLRTLLAVYKKVKPEYIAFTFDMTRDTFRRTQLGADFYKANRKETAQPLKEQFVQMEEFLKKIGCPVFMSMDYEADDYAASLVEKFQGPELQTYVLTKDHDYFQLVSEYTRMWRVVTKDKLEALKDAYGLYGKDAYEALPPNVFEYTPQIVYSEEGVYPELSNIGRTSFFIKFKEEFGITAKQWMMKQLKKRILGKVIEPGICVKQLMEVCNFESQAQLYRYFKQHFRCTPKQLIDRYQAKTDNL